MSEPVMAELAVWAPGPYVRLTADAVAPADAAASSATVRLAAPRRGFASGQVAVRETGQALNGLTARPMALALDGGAARLPADAVRARFVGAVEVAACESSNLPAMGQVFDPLLEAATRDVPAGVTQPVWLTVDVPADAQPGLYRGALELAAGGRALASIPLELTVEPFTLPAPHDYAFRADFWQHPANLADQYGVARWSDAHWDLVRAYTREIVRGGQKVITTTIIDDPWASQTRVPYPSLVGWTGSAPAPGEPVRFSYDWTLFDRYVTVCMEEGLDGAINAYSMVLGPGNRTDCVIPYRDAVSGKTEKLVMQVGDATYRAAWTQFLTQFREHLRERGWLEKTQLGFDEKPAPVMDPALSLVREVAPEFKIALAGSWEEENSERLSPLIHDYCLIYPGAPAEFAARRRAAGQVTTVYTCCGPLFPNTFTFSPLVEPRLLTWHAAAQGCDGYLRWAWTCWPADPLRTSDFGPWPSGDTFLVYPGPHGPLSSLRWEMFKAGVQDFELITQARRRLAAHPDAAGEKRLAEALALAAREPDGRIKDPAELERARAMVVALLAQ